MVYDLRYWLGRFNTIEGGLGGPFVKNLGVVIPVPNLPLGVRYGVTDRLDVAGHLNLLPIFTGGFLGSAPEIAMGASSVPTAFPM